MRHCKVLYLLVVSVFFTLSSYAQNETHNFINHRGQDLFLSGINVAWMSYGNDLTAFDSKKWEAICDDVVEAGGNSLRWWIHVDGRSTPTYDAENDTVIGISEKALDNLALAMDIAAAKGVVVSLCLWAHGMLCIDDGDGGTIQAKNRIRRNQLLLTDSVATQRYIDNALIPMVTRLKNHTAILCWEIFNEPEGMTEFAHWSNFVHVDISDIQRFVNMCAGAIHRTDPKAKVSNGTWRLAYVSDYNGGTNFYTDSALFANGKDKDGYLDFYMFHYYPNEVGSDGSPFHKDFSTFNLEKNTIIGEFPAYGIVKKPGNTFIPRKQLTTTNAMLWLYNNGYSGGWGWTYTAHDGNGGLDDMREALDTLRKLYPEHIIVKHDPEFNYIPRITATMPDTVLFKNSATVSNYLNANNFFEDDENDVLTYSLSFTGEITAELSEDGYVNFTPIADKTGYGDITITATDKGGKSLSQSFSILIREEVNSSDNKLLNAFVTYSSLEDEAYKQYYANDGDYNTRWSSKYNDDEFICFDMLKEEEIRRIVLYWEWNEDEKKGAYAQAYTIEVSSDNKNWETVFTVKQVQIIKSNIVLRKDDEEPIKCRYVKIHFTERATSWGYSLTEVEAYDFDDHANNASKITISTRTRYQAAEANQEFYYQILRSFFVDENNDILTISASPLPDWLMFDQLTCAFSGLPSPKDTGEYLVTVKAEDYFGINKSYDLRIKVWPSQTGIETIDNISSIFPNPCKNDYVTVSIGNYSGNVSISFCNLYGKILTENTIQSCNGAAICNVANLPKGLYIVKISANNSVYYQKLIIE